MSIRPSRFEKKFENKGHFDSYYTDMLRDMRLTKEELLDLYSKIPHRTFPAEVIRNFFKLDYNETLPIIIKER